MDALRGQRRMTTVAVLGASGAVGGRFVEIVGGEERAPLRVLLHRWWHTARVVRFPVELREAPARGAAGAAEVFASSLESCAAAVSFIDGPEADEALAGSLVDGCTRAGVGRLVHLGCLGSFGAVRRGRLDEDHVPPRPPAEAAGRRWAFEQALLRAGASCGVDVVVVTASLVYGPFTQAGAHRPYEQVERGRVAVAAGSGRCHVVFVDDVIEALWAAVTVAGPVHGRIFASGPAPISWPELFRAFERIVGRPGVAVLADDDLATLVRSTPAEQLDLRWPPPPSAAQRLIGAIARRTVQRGSVPPPRRRLVLPDADELDARSADVEVPLDRAASVLGWTPVVGFDEGMRRTEAYLRWADPRERS